MLFMGAFPIFKRIYLKSGIRIDMLVVNSYIRCGGLKQNSYREVLKIYPFLLNSHLQFFWELAVRAGYAAASAPLERFAHERALGLCVIDEGLQSASFRLLPV